MSRRVTAAGIAASVALAGCGLSNPEAARTRADVRPSTPSTPVGLRTPTAVLAAQRDTQLRVAIDYTLTQATWSPNTYVAQHNRLVELATGPALAELAPRSGQPPAAVVAQLAAAGAGSRATLVGTDGPTPGHEVIVAYKTVATGAGRNSGQPDYAIAHVTLVRHAGRWLVDGFEIQP